MCSSRWWAACAVEWATSAAPTSSSFARRLSSSASRRRDCASRTRTTSPSRERRRTTRCSRSFLDIPLGVITTSGAFCSVERFRVPASNYPRIRSDLMGLWTKKSIAVLQAEAAGESTEHTLRRALGALNLTTLGIGAIIGAGIFVLTGTAAAQYAGPAIVISFIVSGLGCLFAGLCYAEFASMIPIAGSAYTYGYATLGEFIAWIIGWDLMLEYLFGASTVAVGWSGYFTALLSEFSVTLPPAFASAPLTVEGSSHLARAILCVNPATNALLFSADSAAT